MCICRWKLATTCVKIREQLVRVVSLHLSCVSWGWNPGGQV